MVLRTCCAPPMMSAMGTVTRAARGGEEWDGRWRAMWRDHEGRQRSKIFDRKADARRFLTNVEADLARGAYVDPTDRTTVAQYIDTWLPAQVWRPSTRQLAESHLRRHILPELGARQLRSLTRTDVQAFINRLTQPKPDGAGLAPATVEAIHRRLVSILESAVHDRRIPHSPAVKIALPKQPRHAAHSVVTLDVADVERLAAAVPDRLEAFVWVMAGAGLRPGEAAGLTIERTNTLRRELIIDRQLVTVVGQPVYLGPVKTAASARTVPIPKHLADRLAAHIAQHGTIEIPDPTGGTARLLFANRDGRPLRRSVLGDQWARASRRADLPPEARGWHTLRHTYASALIHAGLSVRAVQARLGHASATETLDTYSHLWPDSDDDTRAAIESAGLTGTAAGK